MKNIGNGFLTQLTLLVTLASFWLAPNTLANTNTLKHFTLYFPPYWEMQGDEHIGFHARLSKALYERAELNVTLAQVPYARVSQLKLPEEVAFVAYGANPATDEQFLFPIPQTTITLKGYSLRHHNMPSTINGFKGARVAIKRGFPLGSFAPLLEDNDIIVIELNTVHQAIRLLTRGRVDYVITLEDPFKRESSKQEFVDHRFFESTLESIYGWPIAIVKSHPDANILFEKISTAYQELLAEGVISYEDNRLLLSSDEYH